MTQIKLCGLSRPCDIAAANELKPAYVGFVFAPKSKRYITPEIAAELKRLLAPDIQAVGVFVNAPYPLIAALLNSGIIDLVQLHGDEDANYIKQLRVLTQKPIIKAFRVESERDIIKAEQSTADYVLLDSGAGTGTVFNWEWIQNIKRPYFLAGGLDTDNVEIALQRLRPFAVDVSSGIETKGFKDKVKMAAFVAAVRKEDRI